MSAIGENGEEEEGEEEGGAVCKEDSRIEGSEKGSIFVIAVGASGVSVIHQGSS